MKINSNLEVTGSISEGGTALSGKYYLATNPSGYTTNTGTVIGSSLTSDKIIIGNGTVNVKASTYTISDILAVANGRTKTYVITAASGSPFLTQDDQITYNFTNSGNLTDTQNNTLTADSFAIGDILLITNTDYPDRYVIAKPVTDVVVFAKLETRKIDVPASLDDLPDGSTRKLANYLPLTGGTLASSSTNSILNITASTSNKYANIAIYNTGNTYKWTLGQSGSDQSFYIGMHNGSQWNDNYFKLDTTVGTAYLNSVRIATVNDLQNYLPLSGGSLTGGITVNSQSGGGGEYRITRPGSYDLAFMIGSGNINRGIYDYTNSDWMIYRDDTTNVYVKGSIYENGTSLSSKYLSLSGGTLSSTSPNILTVKRSTGGLGAYIDFNAANQSANSWRIGPDQNYKFNYNYSSDSHATDSIKFSIDKNGNVTIQGKLNFTNTLAAVSSFTATGNYNELQFESQNGKYAFQNSDGDRIEFNVDSTSTSREYTFPDKSGTVALNPFIANFTIASNAWSSETNGIFKYKATVTLANTTIADGSSIEACFEDAVNSAGVALYSATQSGTSLQLLFYSTSSKSSSISGLIKYVC